MRRWLLAMSLVGACGAAQALDVNPRYARESLGYLSAGIASQLAKEDAPTWKRRVAQDVSVLIAANTYSLQLMAWSRFRPGFACLVEAVGKPKADDWLDRVLKAHLREPADLERWNQASKATESWPEGPAEDCKAPPRLLRS